MDDDAFASTVACAILQMFNAIATCAADGEAAVNRWDDQPDDQQLDVVCPTRTPVSQSPSIMCFRGQFLTGCYVYNRYYWTGSLAVACPGWTCSNIFSNTKMYR